MTTERKPIPFEVLVTGGDAGTDSYRYRVEHAMEQLDLAGVPVTPIAHGTQLDALRPSRAERAVLLMHRMGLDAWSRGAIQAMHRRGWPVVADIDDLVFDVQVTPWVRFLELVPGSERSYNEGAVSYRRCLQAADAILATSDFLAEEAGKLGRQAYVHPNAPSLTEMALCEHVLRRAGERPPEQVTIGYFSGTPTHNYDFRACAGGLAALLRAHPDVRLLIVGPLDVDARLAPFSDRITHLPRVEWQRLPGIIRQADINLAPLEMPNPFCLAKSELKYIEAALVGVASVASPTPAFRRAITHGVNGLLADGDDAWFEALDGLVRDAAWRRRVGEAARRDVYERYHPRALGEELVRILSEIVEARQAVTHGQVGRLGRTAAPEASWDAEDVAPAGQGNDGGDPGWLGWSVRSEDGRWVTFGNPRAPVTVGRFQGAPRAAGSPAAPSAQPAPPAAAVGPATAPAVPPAGDGRPAAPGASPTPVTSGRFRTMPHRARSLLAPHMLPSPPAAAGGPQAPAAPQADVGGGESHDG